MNKISLTKVYLTLRVIQIIQIFGNLMLIKNSTESQHRGLKRFNDNIEKMQFNFTRFTVCLQYFSVKGIKKGKRTKASTTSSKSSSAKKIALTERNTNKDDRHAKRQARLETKGQVNC